MTRAEGEKKEEEKNNNDKEKGEEGNGNCEKKMEMRAAPLTVGHSAMLPSGEDIGFIVIIFKLVLLCLLLHCYY